jgi:hypothetical protein
MPGSILLYRAVCQAEYDEFQSTRQFAAISSSVQGKWFALERVHAQLWGTWFASKSGIPHDRIIAVEMPLEMYHQFEPVYEKLDGIGPACFAPIELLRGVSFQEVLE